MRPIRKMFPGLLLSAALGVTTLAHAADTDLAATQKRAEAGDAHAQVAWGNHLFSSKDRKLRDSSTEWFRKAAMQGDHDAEWMLGSAYMAGYGVQRDGKAGLDWMRRSLADGTPDHMAIFGITLLTMNAIAGDQNDGVEWLNRSVTAGSAQGMNIMGVFHLSGAFGVSKDPTEGERLMLKAAGMGNADAQASLGALYLSDLLGAPKPAEGVRWLETAANQGNADSQGTLAYLLITGDKGVTKDPARGVTWAEKAAAKNNARGYYALGLAYLSGNGEQRDPAQAWFNLGVAERLDTKHQLTKVADHMSEAATQLNAGDLERLRARIEKIPKPEGAS
ncbi:MAG: Secretory immunoglobulin A-binding protein EsiB [Luteibacter sp.]|uniref:tetratricopeptide repeat protein n=1 Tax=Luteibacter sp. TaxID=1886636 RepID=UPI00137F194D|nr:tetratricopeptide repeat protein [Luteibacter sp.]KAF1007222.1 MAG: Secretory immunoglobulin A-binding protein EsiB [Luteibacter sp.]